MDDVVKKSFEAAPYLAVSLGAVVYVIRLALNFLRDDRIEAAKQNTPVVDAMKDLATAIREGSKKKDKS